MIHLAKNASDIDALKNVLAKLEPGSTISYQELANGIGRDVTRAARHLLQSACNQLLNERRMAFAAVRKVGIKRLTAEEAVNVGMDSLSRIRGYAKRGIQKISSGNFADLSNEMKIIHNGYVSVLATIAYAADPRNMSNILACSSTQQPLPRKETLALLAS